MFWFIQDGAFETTLTLNASSDCAHIYKANSPHTVCLARRLTFTHVRAFESSAQPELQTLQEDIPTGLCDERDELCIVL